ncbi:conserved Plasmodium protein, unknown function [Plasmodium knowlesi strain H]|uniref:Nucleoporin NUP205 n=3 Tax=Plasmodium knowlesi TaxID=5850 RepID=A0A5K1VDP7_PLAKH|nr:nucleoporin NUP205, putative [Plasmodium knowlesi strain H]OTN64438.1 Uncharacterized protein PKNOH_S130173200 [Plasmodium knowlesi]CAA9988900.1 nucleoporin NUP205, putative [Plasmodium knowlesi strain H]SBO24744.1 conserved Plasmodium protein, unknown function [Plasmodium knowlesi strain H]SBO28009.1 conserved Plasmodium protein, unknown function [Plasmodium knowlesi strain H]VVS78374.1 nucleoporin NUP205, putative [Plasmodium knowlesi strain H]|eukprot:XP_002261247.1 hypothetical protein, conserved in Plasmodium species [Plasmodium knowlesi strain H]
MDVDDNGAKFFGMNKYENYVNKKKSKENKNGISNSKGEDINPGTGEYDKIDAHEDNDQSYEGFVTVSDQSSCVSSIYKNNFYDDDDEEEEEEEVEKNASHTDEDEKFNSVNGTNQSSASHHPESNTKNNSEDSMSDEEYATYIDQKEKYVNKILNRGDNNSYEDNDDDFLESLEKSGKKLGKKNNWKRLFSFSRNSHTEEKDERYKTPDRSEPVEKAARYGEPDTDQPKSAGCANGKSSQGDPADGHSDNQEGENSDVPGGEGECKDGEEEDDEDDLYSVISGSDGDNEIFLTTKGNNKACMATPKGDNAKKDGQGTIESRQGREIHNEGGNEEGASPARAKATRRIRFQDEMMKSDESVTKIIQNEGERLDKKKKQIPIPPHGVNTIPSEEKTKRRHKEKGKHFQNKKNYEFRELVSSTINMCHPKIKGINDTDDILSNMEKISKIVILDDRSRGSGTNEVEEDESTNSLYDDVDNILDDRKKMYMKKKNEYLMRKTKTEGLANTTEDEKGKEQSSEGGNLNDLQKNSSGRINPLDNKTAQVERTDFMYYLNNDMIELNENVFKLYHGTCDYTHRNLCARNIINIVPHLNNIYERQNLSYIKDSPNFDEVYKVVPEWKNSFEMLNKKAQEDTEDMKNVLRRIENIQNDLDELGRELIEDKKEFENIKFETVQHESMITNLEKKNKMLIKGVLKLDNISFKLKKIHNINTNNMNNFTIVENVNRLLKYMDSSLSDYSQLFSEEKTMDILRFQPIDNVYNFLTNTDDESCFIMNLLKEELKEMILEKKDQMQNIIRKTMLYNAYDTNSYKEHITNTLNKQSLMINRIKCNIHSNVMLLFEMYEKFEKKNMKVVKIGQRHIKNYLNDERKASYIVKSVHDNKKNISKYFNSINFTRNKPIIHPFFIHFCLSEHFVHHFITFVLDPLSDQHQKNFLQYCSVPGFSSPLFVEKIVKLYRQEEQFTKSDTSYDFRSAYSRIILPELLNLCNNSYPNQQYERWNEENQYLIALKMASDFCFKSLLENNQSHHLSSVDTNNAFNLFHYIPESITNMSASSTVPNQTSYTALNTNNNFTFSNSSTGPLSSFGMRNFGSSNKFGTASPFSNNTMMMMNSSSTLSSNTSGMFGQSTGSVFPGGTSSTAGMFGSFNASPATSGMNPAGASTNQFGGLSNQFGGSSNQFGGSSNQFGGSSNQFGVSSNQFGGSSNQFGGPASNTFGTNNVSPQSGFNQNRSNSFLGGTSGGMFGSTNSTATGGSATQLGNSSSFFGGTANSSTGMFGSNFKQSVSNNMFGNNPTATQPGTQLGGGTSNLFGTSGSASKGNFFNSNSGGGALGMSTNTMSGNTGLFNQGIGANVSANVSANTNNTLFGGLPSNSTSMSNSQFAKSGQMGSSNLFSSGPNTAGGMNMNMNSQNNNSGNMFLSLNNQSNTNIFSSNNNSGSPFGKNFTSGSNPQLKDNMFSSTQSINRNPMMSSNFFSANKDTTSTGTNNSTFFSNTSMGNTSTGVNTGAYPFGNKQNFGTSGIISGGISSGQANQSGDLFNRGGMYAGQMSTVSRNTNFNNLTSNINSNNRMDNSLSANKYGNYFENNSTSKNSIFATSANNLSSNSNNNLFNINSGNKNSNMFNNPSSNNTSMGSMFGGNVSYGSNANSLSYNNSTGRNTTNNLLSSQNNNQFRSSVGMMSASNTPTNNSNNLFLTNNNKSSFMFSNENKGISNPTTYNNNNLFQNASNSFLSNNTPGMTSPSNMSSSLFQKSTYSSLNQNKPPMSNFNTNNNNPSNFGLINQNGGIMGGTNIGTNSNVNRFQQNGSSNFPSVFNPSNKGNTIFSR